jgi:disulfide bond formation protein DsbB
MFGISMAGYNLLYALALAAFVFRGALRRKAA